MPAYHSIFDHGDSVTPLSRDDLLTFQKEWAYHHPIHDTQLRFAGARLFVDLVSYYHGGDPLYSLFSWNKDGTRTFVPGLWHEAVLTEAAPAWIRVKASDLLIATAEDFENQPAVVIRNIRSGVSYAATRHSQNELVSKCINEVFQARDVHMAAMKYGFELDFTPEPRHAL